MTSVCQSAREEELRKFISFSVADAAADGAELDYADRNPADPVGNLQRDAIIARRDSILAYIAFAAARDDAESKCKSAK